VAARRDDAWDSVAEKLARLPRDQRRAYVLSLPRDLALRALYSWRHWARPKQLLPTAAFYVWLILAGRGFGKTRTGAEAVRGWVEAHPIGFRPLRIALVAETAGDARDVLVEGESGIMAISPPWCKPLYEPSKRRLTWVRQGRVVAIATTYAGAEPEQLRGPQFDKAWVDELAKYKYPDETWENLTLAVRLGLNPQMIVTTTPKPIPVIRDILADRDTIPTRGSTYENLANLAPRFISRIRRKYEGTRLGKQEIYAELLDDLPGALWTRAMLDKLRIHPNARTGKLILPEMDRIVVAIDPSGSDTEDSDEAGIIVAGRGLDGDGYVWDDRSGIMSPAEWGTQGVRAYAMNEADLVVGETNYGGDMVETVIRGIELNEPGLKISGLNVPFRKVVASRGKHLRAEPVSALYEQHRVHHAGSLAQCEDEMVMFTTKGYQGGASPNRADALVFALTELMIENDYDDGESWPIAQPA
jgi:phage terminase large subunit-like protein